jgi:hypothetical protein
VKGHCCALHWTVHQSYESVAVENASASANANVRHDHPPLVIVNENVHVDENRRVIDHLLNQWRECENLASAHANVVVNDVMKVNVSVGVDGCDFPLHSKHGPPAPPNEGSVNESEHANDCAHGNENAPTIVVRSSQI